jgi:hypothetical protein
MSIDWGSVPDWLAAVGTISAVGWALHLGLRDGKRLDIELEGAAKDRAAAAAEREAAAEERELYRKDRAEEKEAEKRRLAAQVTLIAEKSYSHNEKQNGFLGRAVNWSVHNGGNEPISMVTLVQREIDPESGAETGNADMPKQWNVIEAGGTRRVLTELGERTFHPNREVQFNDGSGVRWQRKSLGALRLLEGDDPEATRIYITS